MNDIESRAGKRRGLMLITALISLLVFIPSVFAWLVNLHVAIQSLVPGWHGWIADNPDRIVGFFVSLSEDLSTISTFVFVLLSLFPLVQSLRILKKQNDGPASVYSMEALPYPAHFPFFLVMLGLAGTLYGLWIGLGMSGVSAMTESMPDASGLSSSLDRLLGGTATALLSSLIGLIGAFLAANPIPFLFKRAAGIDPVAEEQSLAETIEHLTRDLKTLSAASRDVSENLPQHAIKDLLANISELGSDIRAQTEAQKQVAQKVDNMATVLESGVNKLDKIDSIAEAVNSTGARFDQVALLLEKMVESEQQSAKILGNLLEELQGERRDSIEQLTALRKTMERESEAARSGRGKLDKAFAAYIGGEQ